MQARYCDEQLCPSVCLSNAWIVSKRKHAAKKGQLWLLGRRLRAFQWAQDEQRTLPLTRKGGLKRDYHIKNWAFLEESLPKLCSKVVWPYLYLYHLGWRVTAIRWGLKVVWHSLAYLTVHKWLAGDVPFYVKFSAKVTHSLQKRRFPIDICL